MSATDEPNKVLKATQDSRSIFLVKYVCHKSAQISRRELRHLLVHFHAQFAE